MPLISETQKKALVKLCAMGDDWYSIKGICVNRTARALKEKMFVKMGWSSSYEGHCIKATTAGRAYVELLKVIEILRAKVDALQVPEEKQRSDEVDGSEKHFVHLLRKGRNRP